MTGMRNRRGATLPLAIIWIALLSVGAVAGLSRLSSERRTTGNLQAEVDAYALAQNGLARYLSGATAAPATTFDTTIALPGGSAAVSVRRIRASGSGLLTLYVLRSTSSYASAVRYDARTPPAARTVAQYAHWVPGSMTVHAAWTSLTGLEKNGGSGTIAGADQCGAAPAVAGVAVPTTAADGGPGYHQNGGSSVPTGSPNISTPAADPAGFGALIDIDWDGIVNGGALTPQYSLTSTSGWPASFTNWPIIYVDNATTITLNPPLSGRGLLVVRGNLALSGSFSWDGVILVGGTLTSNGNQTIQGAVVTGLNVKLGQMVGTSDVGNGTKTVRYNSCNVANALQNLGSLRLVSNGWVDNWPGY